MNRLKIRLDTMKDINKFLCVTTKVPFSVTLTNGDGYTVNGKSYLGIVYASAEWTDIYCLSEQGLSDKLSDLIVDDD